MHNGFIEGYLGLRRELLLAVDPSIFSGIAGTTDSELMFYLALTFGLQEEPLAALERMAGFVEETGRRRGIDQPLQMTVAVSDGERLYAARYASGPVVNSLFVTADASAVRALYPDDARLQQFSDEARAVVSEPLGDLPGAVARGTRGHRDRRPARRRRSSAVHAADRLTITLPGGTAAPRPSPTAARARAGRPGRPAASSPARAACPTRRSP